MARDKDGSETSAAGSAVERSLEDFIARANTTLPAPAPEVQAALGSRKHKKKTAAKAPGTLVVLGPQTPLAEVTEIVNRVPVAEIAAPPRRSFAALGLGLAFVAGAVAVFIATRFISGSPAPVTPAAPLPSATVVDTAPMPAPAPVVSPMPVIEAPPAPAPLAVEPAPVAAPVAVEPVPDPAPRPAQKRTARKPQTPPPAKKAASGLVDPFAN